MVKKSKNYLKYLYFPAEKNEKVITGFWALPRPTGKYRWRFPKGLLDRIGQLIPFEGKKILHLFCGISKFGDIRIDINPKVKPNYILDLTRDKLPFKDETFDIVIADPPYYNFPPYSFVSEASRVVKKGGYLIIFHQLIYIRPKGFERFAQIAVSCGPNTRIRTLSIFKKTFGDVIHV